MSPSWLAPCVLMLLSSARTVLSWTFHLPKIGGCPDLAAQQDFMPNIDKFMQAPWYVQSSFDTEILQGKGRCMTASYKYNPLNKAVLVATAQFNEDNNSWERLDATATPANATAGDAKFDVYFDIPIWGKVSGKYSVLGTDYETYSVIHGCGSFFSILHYDCSWLMSRKQKLAPEEEEEFYNSTSKVLENYDSLDPKEFKKVDQVNCDK
ncbi:apolipoprotein D-like [Homalodisca vitripennis]|uniref:apolipoprotein D-like n=1 Tax=Homalodisca vitripennis TaxID=197043 RepID=UPI001EEA37E6|nr:apolipoprotein D-like [Homalodisca vitripennis]XP_046675821.1 apolipoprotein D-like [Homalodisca vitripennis]XP_046675822.1 apolipoprotein D-like [Homalodisca vitripennis]XP_046675824.1 apolipoprotein D-like [Homalodisca vitripennis]XP_046675825.1 apolipoprotein D-like [Homalodisca vitripennis]XP_046675826.1 apolipoprotein D-like [Homalodisca vitripennis]XP_046675827.1 apolipoprotein D-like [Homalodisca vitripennis]XP_046675828.1 apolipoprotein D-like [Homalodisca vitripennis]XP_04667583